jgi:peptidoglycan/xylan/chitin deacetylase (PgdA/CDA1 family)
MDVLILCYHAVSPDWKATLSVRPDSLERQLAWLLRLGWKGDTFRGAVLSPATRRTFAVTFDDGFSSVFEQARPILSELGVPATVFVPSAFPSTAGPLLWPGVDHWARTDSASELSAMTWDQLGTLAQDGWEIGSHTCTHPHLTTLDDDSLRTELEESRAEIGARLGLDCLSIAYPFGDVDSRVAGQADAAGYTLGASMSSHLAEQPLLRWPRVGVYQVDPLWRFALKATRSMRWVRASKVWPNATMP